MFDILIQNGTIVDGSGTPAYQGDVGINNGRIIGVGHIEENIAKQIIDATDLIVSPGFIDVHSHDDLHVLENPAMNAKLLQGVTTTITGNCGFSLYPVLSEHSRLFYEYATGIFGKPESERFGFSNLEAFFHAVEESRPAINVASLVAHGVLRISVMGYENRKATFQEMEKMKELLREAMRSGAVGMSMGLIYPPGSYADTNELVELSKVVAEEGGIITSHIRNEAQYLMDAIDEMLYIAKEAHVPLEISHLKACGIPNFGKGRLALEKIAKARREGIDVTFDQYPYPAGSTTATTLLPPWTMEEGISGMMELIQISDKRRQIKQEIEQGISGSSWEPMSMLIGWENILICSVQSNKNKGYEGRYIQDITNDLNIHPVDFLLDLLVEEKAQVMLILFQQDLEDMETIMKDELQMFGSDGLPLKGKKAHPRLYGTYPRVLGTYVREKHLLTLEKAIQKMTYLPANRFKLYDRGLIRPGMAADLTLFHEDMIADRSSYTQPDVHPEGIEFVIVNGAIACQANAISEHQKGRPIKK